MASFIASYDLKETNPDPHSTFIAEAIEQDWFTWVRDTKGKYYKLPDTTLISYFSSRDAAVKSFHSIAAKVRARGYTVIVEKWIVAEYSGSNFNSDRIDDD